MVSKYVFSFVLSTLSCYTLAFNVTILHTNDVHCRFLSFNAQTRNCEAKDFEKRRCWGGAARRQTLIKNLRQKFNNVLLLDAGDQYQGLH